MNPDADHQFCVPPALEDEIGTELKFAQRGERGGGERERWNVWIDLKTLLRNKSCVPPRFQREREKETERERKRERERERERVCVCVRERERESVCVCVNV